MVPVVGIILTPPGQLLVIAENPTIPGADVPALPINDAGKPAVIENAFVSQKHYLIFGTFFNQEIDNWYCDDWITEVYKPNYSTHCVDIRVENKIVDNRYNIKPIGDKIRELIENDKKLL